jgi:ribonucleoside-diphosphate reductase alpha chain
MPFLEKGGACAERDALLGVSITGIAENDIWHEDVLARGKEIVKITNAEYAGKLGIKVAVRATTIKPSGTASLLLGTSSGIHPHHARRYWRRVTANPLEPVAQEFRKVNPHMVEVKPNGDWCLTFPMEGNTRDWDVFKMAIHFQKYWSDHNVSATVPYTPDMDEIIWENRHNIGAMAFLPVSEDTYPYMPREEVRDLSAWARVIDKYRPVDYCSGRTVSPGCDSESCTS